jgi:hypothetical protein
VSINEILPKGAPPIRGILDSVKMHGVDQSQPVADNSGMVIHLGPGGKVLGVSAKGGRKPKGTIQTIPASPSHDLDNLPEYMEPPDNED